MPHPDRMEKSRNLHTVRSNMFRFLPCRPSLFWSFFKNMALNSYFVGICYSESDIQIFDSSFLPLQVPPYEIARVLADGVKSKELFSKLCEGAVGALDAEGVKEKDVETFVKIYEQLGLKSNIPTEVIEHIDK